MYYNKKLSDVFEELDSKESGLSQDEAKNRLEKYGLNSLKKEKKISVPKLILAQFKDPLIYILLIAAFFTFVVKEYIDMWVIVAIVIINALVGFLQEFKAEKAMQAIKDLTSPNATVHRGSDHQKIEAKQLVPGDVIILSAGNRVPADVRLFQIKDLRVDESMFTGESRPAKKNEEIIEEKNTPLADQKNMAFMGSVVVQGKAKGLVVATGTKSELGKISEQVSSTEKEQTPLQKRLAYFSKIVGIISLVLSGIVFGIGMLKGKPVNEMILFSISMAVSVIPEGLPIVITITMAIGMKRMADRQAIIRKLIAVETLGSCNYICSDKTGTITENVMMVTQAFTNNKLFEFKGQGYEPKGDIYKEDKKIDQDEDLEELLLTGALCNSAELYHENNEWLIEGDPTEGALLVSACKYGIDIDEQEEAYKQVDEIPFNSETKYMGVLRKQNDQTRLFIKGAPEVILDFADPENKDELQKQAQQMAEQGLRVLAFAVKNIDASGDSIDLEKQSTQGIDFLGFQGIIDPPRESAIQAVEDTREAGIETVMITGDHKITAQAIAKRIGILDEDELVVEGKELDENGEQYLNENAENIGVYARVSPNHKLLIVKALQEKGHVVAVTGDGVNDAPALKKGNIGVAMGKVGTDVAREAADMVLKDDNFATIFEAVKVGRVIFENIRKVVFFLLGTAVGVAAMIIVGLLLNLPLPFLATQILWINLVTNGLQDVALAYEPGEEDISKRKPRDPEENIINRFVLIRLGLIGLTMTVGTLVLFWHKLEQGSSIEYARTVAFNTVVFYQLFHVLNSRSFIKSIFQISPLSNPFLFISIFVSLAAQFCVLYVPFMQYIFDTRPLDLITWLQILPVSLSIILVMEIDKLIRRKFYA